MANIIALVSGLIFGSGLILAGMANPGKLMPTPRLCGEVPGPYRQHPLEAAGIAERM